MSITCEYVTLHAKSDFADVIQLRVLKSGDYPGLSRWQKVIEEKAMWWWKQEVRVRWGRSLDPKNTGRLWWLAQQGTDSPSSLQKELVCQYLDYCPIRNIWYHQNYKIKHLCFKSQILSQFVIVVPRNLIQKNRK